MSKLDVMDEGVELTPIGLERGQQNAEASQGRTGSLRGPQQTVIDSESAIVTRVSGDTGNGSNIQELPAVDGGWKAWRFVASAFALEVMIWGYEYSYGIYQDYYTSHPPFDKYSTVSIAAVGTTSLAIQCGETLLLSMLFERYPDWLRVCTWASLVVTSLCLLLASFVSQIWLLIALQGVIYGIAGGFLYFPIIALLPQWFSRKRGLATGIIFSGSGIGGFAFPFLLQALLGRYGFRWTLRIWAAATFVVGAVAILGMQPRLPVPKYSSGQRPRAIPPQMHFLRTPLFWLLGLCTILHAMSYYSVSLYIAPFTKTISSNLAASIVLALFNSSGTVCQIVVGHLCDRFPYVWIMIGCTLISGLAVFLLWGFAQQVALVAVFAIIFGGLMGGFSSIGPASANDCAGDKPEQTNIVWAWTFLIRGIAVVIGPLISGVLYSIGQARADAGGYAGHGFKAMEVFVGVCTVATSLASVGMAVTKRRTRA